MRDTPEWNDSDAEILAWADRHNCHDMSLTDARAMLEDARSLHMVDDERITP